MYINIFSRTSGRVVIALVRFQNNNRFARHCAHQGKTLNGSRWQLLGVIFYVCNRERKIEIERGRESKKLSQNRRY